MNIDESDFFKHLESSFTDASLPKLSHDPLNDIIAQSSDPVECAANLHNYVIENPEDAQSTLMRRGLAKLSDRYNGLYLHKNLTVTAGGGFAIPEPKPYLRKREVMTAAQFEGGTIFVMGKLATFSANYYHNVENDDQRTLITLRLLEPYLLDSVGQVLKDRTLPDYMHIPIPHVTSYSFGQDKETNG